MNFDRAQQALEVLQTQCPKTDTLEIGAWISAITRAREVLFELQVMEDEAVTGTQASGHWVGATGIEPKH